MSTTSGTIKGFTSKLVHAGAAKPESVCGSVVTPIYQTSTFAFENAYQGARRFNSCESDGYIYTRLGNPTVRALEDCICALEGGIGAVATSSGMGAVVTALTAILKQGDHIISTAAIYGPTRTYIDSILGKFGVSSSFVDTSDLDALRHKLSNYSNIRLIYVETPSNPLLQITDLIAVAQLAHEHGALLVVDSTFASPYLQQPLCLGADVVLHSVSKFINGHADVIGGVIVAGNAELLAAIHKTMTLLGCCMDPHQAFLVHRGIKTLSLRMEKAQQNAQMIASWLENHSAVNWVRYPGLLSHPQHKLACRQMSGFGTMISFELKGGLSAGRQVMDRVRLAALAVSLGGVETLIEHPASMTHCGVAKAEREAAGITDGLVRYSAGIEDINDLLDDLERALSPEAVRCAIPPVLNYCI